MFSLPQVKRFSLYTKAVKHISFEDKAEYFATCCGDNYISVSSCEVLAPNARLQQSEQHATAQRCMRSSTVLVRQDDVFQQPAGACCRFCQRLLCFGSRCIAV